MSSFEQPSLKWQIMFPGRLWLAETRLAIDYTEGLYQVHRLDKKLEHPVSCHGGYLMLGAAKLRTQEVISELMEMGIDP